MNRLISITSAFLAFASSAWSQSVISYWSQNNNALNTDPVVFGFQPESFPQPADQGNGTITLGNFNTDVNPDTGAYLYIPSFAGNVLNALPEILAGGSLSPQVGPEGSNNGMHIDFNVSTVGFADISISWAQRGTSTGFNSREFYYSEDGGVNFTLFATDTGALPATWAIESYDLSAISSLNNNHNVVLRLVLNGGSSSAGNNRFDNILITGNPSAPTFVKPVLTTAILGENTLQINCPSQSGFLYQLQSSPDLASWNDVGTPVAGNDSVLSFEAAAPTAQDNAVFFQVVITPQG